MSSSPGHEKAAGEQISGCLGGQPLAQALHGASLQARHLHLRDMQDAGGALLRQAVIKPQGDDLPLPLRELAQRLTQGGVFDHALFLIVVPKRVLERKAGLPVLLLQGLRRAGGRLGGGDLFGLEPGLGRELGERRLAAERLLQARARRADALRTLLDAAADLDRAVIAQKAPDLARDLWDNVL